MPFSPEFLEEMRALLVSRRLELAKRQLKTHDEILNIRDSDDGVHDSLDTTMLEQETSSHVKAKERELLALREVDAALARLEDGTYGICEDTGEELKRSVCVPILWPASAWKPNRIVKKSNVAGISDPACSMICEGRRASDRPLTW
ncbi:MAG: hypothetical protein R3E66_20850 [bacterium]